MLNNFQIHIFSALKKAIFVHSIWKSSSLVFLGLLFGLVPVYSNAQETKQDSLTLVSENRDVADSVRINALLELADLLDGKDPVRSLQYSRQSLKKSVESKFIKGIFQSFTNMGFYYRTINNYDSALYFYDNAMQQAEDKPERQSKTYYAIGNIYKAQEKFDKAIDNYLLSQRVSDASGNVLGSALANLGSGSVYIIQRNHERALVSFLKANEYFKELHDKRGVYISLNNIGSVYYKMKKYEEAKRGFLEARDLALQVNDIRGIANIYGNMGSIYEFQNQLDSAVFYGEMALKTRKRLNQKEGIIISYHTLSSVFVKKKDFSTSELYLDSALLLAKEINSLKSLKFNWNYRLQLDSVKGDFKGALAAMRKYNSYRSEIEAVSMKGRMAELETQYASEKKDNEIAVLSQQAEINQLKLRQRNYSLGGAILLLGLLLVGGYLYFKQRKLAEQKTIGEIEQRFLRSQMNPHFIFNALTSIQNYLMKNDPVDTSVYLSRFAKLMRQILENSRKEFVSLSEEVSMLTNYMEVQKLRFSEHLEYEIKLPEDTDPDEIQIPPMFAQPFIENALEHGLRKDKSGLIEIVFTKENDLVNIRVVDNGEGINLKKRKDPSHKSLATKITKERLSLIGKRMKRKLNLVIENVVEDNIIKGTEVSLSVPYKFS